MEKLNKLLVHISMILGMIFLSFSANTAQTNITINASQKYQTIEGFGLFLECRPGQTSDIGSSDLFDILVNDLGISIMRIPFPAGFEMENDNSDPNTFNWSAFDPSRLYTEGDCFGRPAGTVGGEYNIELRMVEGFAKAGTRFFVTPWIIPNWLWSSHNREVEYAEMMSAFVQDFQKRGISIEWISILNEPDMGVCMGASPSEVAQLAEALRARFEQDGLSTKIIAPECGAWNANNYNPSAVGMPNVYAYHYGVGNIEDDDARRIRSFWDNSRIPIWNTEFWAGWASQTDSHEEAMSTAVLLHDFLTGTNCTGLIFFNGYGSGGGKMVLIKVSWRPLRVTGYTPKYYSFRQFSRYIPVGAQRIAAVGNLEGILTSAYLHPDGIFTIVALNTSDQSKPMDFSLIGLSVSSLNKIRYSKFENSQPIGNITVSGNSFTDTLPASSVTTYTTQSYNFPPVVDVTPPMPPTGVRVNNP